jgi:hypothetical protein
LNRAKTTLDEIGLGGERMDMFFMSGSQGNAFAMAAQTMTERIRKLGPNPLKAKKIVEKVTEVLPTEEEEDGEFRGRRSRNSM